MAGDERTDALRERGFALVAVLWITGLLAVMTAGLALSVRTNLRVTANIIENEKAEALADAGVTLAILDLVNARTNRAHRSRFPVGGVSVGCVIAGEGALRIEILDESGKVDVNAAGVPLLQALIAGLGETPTKAAQLADAIFDFRDADNERRPNGAEIQDYRAAGLGWPPKNARLQSVLELGQVYGMTPGILGKLSPYVGVHSGLAGIDASQAPPELIALLRAGMNQTSGAFGSFPDLDTAVALPVMFLASSARRYFTVLVDARSESGAVFVREAVIDMGQERPGVLMSWRRGRQAPGTTLSSAISLPYC